MSRQIFEKPSNIKFMKIGPVGVELFHADGQMDGRIDGHDEANRCFFKISRKRLKSGPYRPYAQKSETHRKQGATLVGRRQGKDNYKSHISFSAAQQPNTVLRCLTLRFLDYMQKKKTHTHTHTAGLL